MTLTREKLESDFIRRMIRESQPDYPLLSDAELERSLADMLARWDQSSPVWVFGYGSLIWNPCVHVAEWRAARLFGFHRRFCLWTPLGRGSPDNPGLVLGLESGGSCHGVALALPPAIAREELTLIWRREMLSGSYRPRWVRLKDGEGQQLDAIAFVINHGHERYAGRLDEARQAEVIATAEGNLGSCYDYLTSTLDQLTSLGLRDPHLESLAARVAERRRALAGDAAAE